MSARALVLLLASSMSAAAEQAGGVTASKATGPDAYAAHDAGSSSIASKPAAAQSTAAQSTAAQPTASSPSTSAQPAADSYDKDLDVDPAEPDFTVIDMPTNLRLPRHKLAFRITHRFARALGQGDFGNLVSDLFGLDSGAQVGVGLRYGLFHGTQLGLYRTSDRTIAWQLQHELLRQPDEPLAASLVASVEGLHNFGLSAAPLPPERHEFSPALSLLLSRRLGSRGAVYVQPGWVGHTRISPSAPGADDNTLLLGLGARLRVTKVMSVLGEVHPRLAGYRGDLGSGDPDPLATFGLEWRVGGHAFQLDVSNALGSTPAQLARGAQGASGWFIGFNLTRKFY